MYSEHPSEFPLENLPVMIDPTLLIFGILLLIGAGVAGFLLGRHRNPKAVRYASLKHRLRLHEEIDKAVKEATGAPDSQIIHKAERLQRRVQSELGDVVALGPTLSAIEALRRALAEAGQGGDHGGHGGHDGGAIIVNTGHLVVNAAEPASENHHSDHADGHSRARTHAETVEAVRAGVNAVNNLWSNKSARLDELRRAQIQLSPPR